jgi:hypothetical protein
VTQPTFTAVRKALASFITAQTGLRATAQADGRINPPAAAILPVTGSFIRYDATMDGTADLSLRALVMVQMGSAGSGQGNLDPYLATTGSQSLYAAFKKDPTAGGAVHFAVVREATGYGVVNHGGVDYLGCSLIIDIGI